MRSGVLLAGTSPRGLRELRPLDRSVVITGSEAVHTRAVVNAGAERRRHHPVGGGLMRLPGTWITPPSVRALHVADCCVRPVARYCAAIAWSVYELRRYILACHEVRGVVAADIQREVGRAPRCRQWCSDHRALDMFPPRCRRALECSKRRRGLGRLVAGLLVELAALFHQTPGVGRRSRQGHLLAGGFRIQHHELPHARGSHCHRDLAAELRLRIWTTCLIVPLFWGMSTPVDALMSSCAPSAELDTGYIFRYQCRNGSAAYQRAQWASHLDPMAARQPSLPLCPSMCHGCSRAAPLRSMVPPASSAAPATPPTPVICHRNLRSGHRCRFHRCRRSD